jgi:hypothetical protein
VQLDIRGGVHTGRVAGAHARPLAHPHPHPPRASAPARVSAPPPAQREGAGGGSTPQRVPLRVNESRPRPATPHRAAARAHPHPPPALCSRLLRSGSGRRGLRPLRSDLGMAKPCLRPRPGSHATAEEGRPWTRAPGVGARDGSFEG